jgi:hypothetical protein
VNLQPPLETAKEALALAEEILAKEKVPLTPADVVAYIRKAKRLAAILMTAKPDQDGDCTVCGLLWPDKESEPHVCPEGFWS